MKPKERRNDSTLDLLMAACRSKDMWAIRCFYLIYLFREIGVDVGFVTKCNDKQVLYEAIERLDKQHRRKERDERI